MEVRTSDLYEAAYYLERGCKLEAVETVRLANGKADCVFLINGDDHPMVFLLARWSRGHTEVNLHAFRQAYSQLNSYVQRERRNQRLEGKRGEA